mgnify:CR=1 FL=1
MEYDSERYDLSTHVTNIIEEQAVSQTDKLRCEIAGRLQQINYRVDLALRNASMGTHDTLDVRVADPWLHG